MDRQGARIIQFPGPKPKAERPAESTIGQAPTPIRPLSEREVDHRRRMLLHLAASSRQATC